MIANFNIALTNMPAAPLRSTTDARSGKTTAGKAILALLASASLASALPYAAQDLDTSPSSSEYSLISQYSGNDFFNHFTTYTGPDPTNGFVNYTDMAYAASQGLIGFINHSGKNATTAYIGVDHTNKVTTGGRNSVRLISKEKFNAGSMAVIDLNHIPSQYGLWPAIWMLGSDGTWPSSGESDILEYVHKDGHNAMTLHTAPGCSVANVSSFQGSLADADCNAGNAAMGCSVKAYSPNKVSLSPQSNSDTTTIMATAGEAFNTQGGGVYVHDWQPDGITVWLFPHSALPADLVAGRPNPSSWTQKPLARFSGGCDFATAFKDMQLIINIDFGGDWAGKVWQSSGAANATGCTTVEQFVGNNPDKFKEAYFDVASVKFFSNSARKGKKSDTSPVAAADMPAPASLMARAIARRNATATHAKFSTVLTITTDLTIATPTTNLTLTLLRRSPSPLVIGPSSSSASTSSASPWFAAAGMFLLVAFFI